MIDVLAALLALYLVALLAWIALLVQLFRRVGALEKEQRETLTALYLHGYAMEKEQREEHATRRRHLNQIQGAILGHISGAVAQLARQLGAAPPEPPIPLGRPLRGRRGARRRQHAEPTARRAA
jgi:hypothetical protein